MKLPQAARTVVTISHTVIFIIIHALGSHGCSPFIRLKEFYRLSSEGVTKATIDSPSANKFMGFQRVGKGVLFLYPAPSVFVSSNLCRGVFKDDQREGQGGGGSTL
ncbi:uncharacterized protein IAS62_003666 [Cryptococcus decagattii]|uniref:Uncharacterized protein n=1 Tax=Cryptococcus decagattii TaxID=1859122 RepID=A0ABZ2AYR9_9TREE